MATKYIVTDKYISVIDSNGQHVTLPQNTIFYGAKYASLPGVAVYGGADPATYDFNRGSTRNELTPIAAADGGFQALSVTSSLAVALTVPSAATGAIITNTEEVRYRADGTAPTTTVGHLFPADGSMTLENARAFLLAVQFIATSTTSVLSVTYFTRSS